MSEWELTEIYGQNAGRQLSQKKKKMYWNQLFTDDCQENDTMNDYVVSNIGLGDQNQLSLT